MGNYGYPWWTLDIHGSHWIFLNVSWPKASMTKGFHDIPAKIFHYQRPPWIWKRSTLKVSSWSYYQKHNSTQVCPFSRIPKPGWSECHSESFPKIRITPCPQKKPKQRGLGESLGWLEGSPARKDRWPQIYEKGQENSTRNESKTINFGGTPTLWSRSHVSGVTIPLRI